MEIKFQKWIRYRTLLYLLIMKQVIRFLISYRHYYLVKVQHYPSSHPINYLQLYIILNLKEYRSAKNSLDLMF